MTAIWVAANLFDGERLTTPPQFVHDCDKCVFLGDQFGGQALDFWFCPEEKGSLIVREGSADADYRSMEVSLALKMAESAGPGSSWSQAYSRYEDWRGQRSAAIAYFPDREEKEPEYEVLVGLYQDIQVKVSAKGNIFFRDQHGNALGVALKVTDSSWEFRPHEDLYDLEEAFNRPRILSGRKVLNLYVLLLAQCLEERKG